MQAEDNSSSSPVSVEIASLSSQLMSSDVGSESQEMMQIVLDRLNSIAATPSQNHTNSTKFTSPTTLDSPGCVGTSVTSRHILNKVVEHRHHISNLFGSASSSGTNYEERLKQVEKLNGECSRNSFFILKRFEEWLNRVEKQNSDLPRNISLTLRNLEERLSQLEKQNCEQLGNVNTTLKHFEERFAQVEKNVEEMKSQGYKDLRNQESMNYYNVNTLKEVWKKCNDSQIPVVNMQAFCLGDSHPQKYKTPLVNGQALPPADSHPQKFKMDKLYQSISEFQSQQDLKQYFQQLQDKQDIKLEKLDLNHQWKYNHAITEINSLKQQFKMAEIHLSFEISKLSQCIEEMKSTSKKQKEPFEVRLHKLEEKYDKSLSEIASLKNQFLQAQLQSKYELNCLSNNILEIELQLENLKHSDIKSGPKVSVEKLQTKDEELLGKIEKVLPKKEESLLPAIRELNPYVEEFRPHLNKQSSNFENKITHVSPSEICHIDNHGLNVKSPADVGINTSTTGHKLHVNVEEFRPHLKKPSSKLGNTITPGRSSENCGIDNHGPNITSPDDVSINTSTTINKLHVNVEEFLPHLNEQSSNLENKTQVSPSEICCIDNHGLNLNSPDDVSINTSTIINKLHVNVEEFLPHLNEQSSNLENKTQVSSSEICCIDNHGLNLNSPDDVGNNTSTTVHKFHVSVEEFLPHLNEHSSNLKNKATQVSPSEICRFDNHGLNVKTPDDGGINTSATIHKLHVNVEEFYPRRKLQSLKLKQISASITVPENSLLDDENTDFSDDKGNNRTITPIIQKLHPKVVEIHPRLDLQSSSLEFQPTWISDMAKYFMDNHRVEIDSADIDNTGAEDNISLHLAVTNGHLYHVSELISKGADLNLKDNKKCTPLFYSASNGYLCITRQLLKHGALIDCKNGIGETPLHVAIIKGHLDIVSELLKHGADCNCIHINQTPLLLAIRGGNLDIVKELIQHGADINKNSGNFNPLHLAAERGYVDIVQELVKCGADIDYKNVLNETALHSAASNGHLNIIDELVKCGADINRTAVNGQTAMQYYDKLYK